MCPKLMLCAFCLGGEGMPAASLAYRCPGRPGSEKRCRLWPRIGALTSPLNRHRTRQLCPMHYRFPECARNSRTMGGQGRRYSLHPSVPTITETRSYINRVAAAGFMLRDWPVSTTFSSKSAQKSRLAWLLLFHALRVGPNGCLAVSRDHVALHETRNSLEPV